MSGPARVMPPADGGSSAAAGPARTAPSPQRPELPDRAPAEEKDATDAALDGYLASAHKRLRPSLARTRRERLWALMDDPGSSHAARLLAMAVMALIAVSVVTFCLETLPAFRDSDPAAWDAIEAVCIAFFSLEFALRVGSCPDLWQFARGWLNAVDLLAVLPFYVELLASSDGSGGSAVFRVVRLVRVFRVFKISRYMSWLRIFTNAMAKSAQPLGMLGFIMSIGMVVFSSAMYYAERGSLDEAEGSYMRADGSRSPFQSIPAAFWWCIVTMTTVGYGDDYPVTFEGKLIATATSLCGILVLAVPITVISANFNDEYDRAKQAKEVHRDRMALLRSHVKRNVRGLDALQDEVAFIVQRSYDDFQEEVTRLVDDSRRELVDEIQNLVSVTYDNMQRDRARRG